MILILPASSGLFLRAPDGTVEHFPARIAIHIVLAARATGWECVRAVSLN